MTKKKLFWYFDFISPFAFLQWPAMQRLAASQDVDFEPRPVLLAALLNHWGHLGPAEIPQKRLFTYRHVQWLAGKRGIALRFPPAHPFNPLKALRLATCLDGDLEAIDAIFNYLWVQGKGLDDTVGFSKLCSDLGVTDPEATLRLPEVKTKLVANGEKAIGHGVFGVPSAVVDGLLFWGQDATEMLLDYLADPSWMRSGEMSRISHLPIGVSRV